MIIIIFPWHNVRIFVLSFLYLSQLKVSLPSSLDDYTRYTQCWMCIQWVKGFDAWDTWSYRVYIQLKIISVPLQVATLLLIGKLFPSPTLSYNSRALVSIGTLLIWEIFFRWRTKILGVYSRSNIRDQMRPCTVFGDRLRKVAGRQQLKCDYFYSINCYKAKAF